jgi:membrane fusion protein (multidrug efflux system)
MLGGVLVVIFGAAASWLEGGRFAGTDDAYVEAAKLFVSTDVSGIVASVDVREGQAVKAGDVLFRLDPRQYQYAFNTADATLALTGETINSMKVDYQRMLSDVAAQRAQVALDQTTFDRYARLLVTNAIDHETYDQARYTLQLDQAKLQSLQQTAQVQLAKLAGGPNIAITAHPQYLQAKAAVDEAQRELDHTTVRAPFAGVVTQVDALQPGTYLVSQTAALTNVGAVALVSTEKVWVTAQIKETDLTYVKPGNRVEISVDSYSGHKWTGSVGSISPASGSEFSILPAQNTSGNWVKVVQRIAVRIPVDRQPEDPVLRVGMTATVSIDTGHRRSLRDLF